MAITHIIAGIHLNYCNKNLKKCGEEIVNSVVNPVVRVFKNTTYCLYVILNLNLN
jgi:hypothetical protein